MQIWDLANLEVKPHQPEVIESEEAGRAIVIQLPSGEELGEHQVHERALLVVISGRVELEDASGETAAGSAGLMAIWEPQERHAVRATEDSRLLLMLAPWPGPGHPNLRNQDEESSG
ncbi:MAG TPA: cupin domain-containing protein [Solirubrobacterales bacterium]|nr:cupin domain-containing protein [Solirubrobacterales bacterium]